MKSLSLLLLLLLSLSLLLLLASHSSSTHTPHVPSSPNSKKLVRHPNDASVSTAIATAPAEKRLVERSFAFPSLSGTGVSVADLGHHAGYYRLRHTHDARMFYFFFESRNSMNDPIVLWLSGGPGCSSSLALFYENGPFKITDNMSLIWNEYGWDQTSNIMFVDQPTGTGFSYSSDERDTRYDEKGVSNDLYDFLQAFFSEHWEYVNNDFYITGESYAGHYIPAFASRLHRANKNNEGTHINFKGFAIGNGFTEPTIQYQAYPDYALDMGLIGESDYQRINKLYPECQSLIKSCGPTDLSSCEYALFKCKIIFSSILEIAGDINRYDIRKKCLGIMCYNFSNIEHFLKLKSVQSILGVEKIEFQLCSDSVKDALEDDRMQNYEVGIPALLNDGIKLLVYAGEYDLMCNWLGNSRWVRSMKWSGQKDFVSSAEIPFMVDGKKAGVLKSHGALSFLKVHRAGHMVPLDQPKAALEMLKRWMQGKLSEIPYNN